MPEWYFGFTCCSANVSISTNTRKRKNLILVLVLALVLMLASMPFSQIRIIEFALVLMSLVKTMLYEYVFRW